MLLLWSRLRDEVTKLQTAARCTALVQFGLKEQVSSLQSRLKLQSEELDAAYTEIEQQQDQKNEQDCDDPELAAELAAELAELMNELEATQRERDEAQAELASSRAGKHPAQSCRGSQIGSVIRASCGVQLRSTYFQSYHICSSAERPSECFSLSSACLRAS